MAYIVMARLCGLLCRRGKKDVRSATIGADRRGDGALGLPHEWTTAARETRLGHRVPRLSIIKLSPHIFIVSNINSIKVSRGISIVSKCP